MIPRYDTHKHNHRHRYDTLKLERVVVTCTAKPNFWPHGTVLLSRILGSRIIIRAVPHYSTLERQHLLSAVCRSLSKERLSSSNTTYMISERNKISHASEERDKIYILSVTI